MRIFLLLFCLIFCGNVHADYNLKKKKKHSKPIVNIAYDYQLAIAAVFCDEAPYLREWLEYYKMLGVEHFYLYNNHSSDHYQEVLAPYIQSHDVDLIQWPQAPQNVAEWDQMQIAIYRDALSLARGKAKWLAIIDLDEFIVPVQDDSLPHVLQKFDALGGVCLIWSFFGTSHIREIPADKTMIETLLYHSGPAAGGQLQHIWNQGAYKSIVRPEYVKELSSPHYCQYVAGKRHEMLNYHEMHINHYWTRDETYFNRVKIPRRAVWGQTEENTRQCAAGMNALTDNNPILRFVPQLRDRLALSP